MCIGRRRYVHDVFGAKKIAVLFFLIIANCKYAPDYLFQGSTNIYFTVKV